MTTATHARMGAFLLFLLLLFPYGRPSAQIPRWSNGELNRVKKSFERSKHLFFGTEGYADMTPGKLERIGEELGEFVRLNSPVIRKQKVVFNTMAAMLAINDFYNGNREQVCEYLYEAKQQYDAIDLTSGDGVRLQKWLKLHFGIDHAFFDELYGNHLISVNDIQIGQECAEEVADTDKDGIIDAEDACPLVKGVVAYAGCPPQDEDEDGIHDLEDECPRVPGVLAYAGCPPPERKIPTPDGGEISIRPDAAVYAGPNGETLQGDNAGEVLLKSILIKGAFDRDRVELRQVDPGTSLAESVSVSSDYVLLRLNLLDSLRKQTVLFKPAQYRILASDDGLFHQDFLDAFAGILRCLQILRNDFGMTGEDFLLLGQGMADKPTFNCLPLYPEHRYGAFTNVPFYRFDGANDRFVEDNYRLAPDMCYDNDDLPFLRSAWLMEQFRRRIELEPYLNSIRNLRGIVTKGPINPNERNATIYIAINRKVLGERATKLQQELDALPGRR
ncbi:MAG: hypothetical protein AAF828_10865 [Bacteroidota bacterium]